MLMKAICSEDPNNKQNAFLSALAEALELDSNTGPNELVAALMAHLASPLNSNSPNQAVPIEAVASFMTETARQQRKEDANRKVSQAMRDGVLPPALRDWATSLARPDPAALDTFLLRPVNTNTGQEG